MRKIGELPDEGQARLFSDSLYVRGLENDVESEDAGGFSIWVHDDDQLPKARELLEEFRGSPEDAKWKDASSGAARKRKEYEKTEVRRNANVITRERIEYERSFTGFAWVPMLLAILSVAATIWAGELGILPSGLSATEAASPEHREAAAARRNRLETLTITKVRRPDSPEVIQQIIADAAAGKTPVIRKRAFYDPRLPEIRTGQIWRLFTPIFVHFGILHLFFNIIWIRDLGGFMQHRFGAGYLLILVLTVAAVSNLVQLAWGGSPMFGGLSGVNYGLLGFLWMRGKFDRGGFWTLNPQIVQTMLVWFVLCLFVIPMVANGAHAGGLVFGMVAGYLTAQLANSRRRRL
jgi:GlpG protein